MHTGGVVPNPPPPLPPPPPPRRRLIPFRIIVRSLVAVSASVGVVALLLLLIYWPRAIRVAVTTATLAVFEVDRFDITPTTITPVLSYNLTATLAVSNPNRRASVYYDRLQAVGHYNFQRFGRAALPVAFQGARRTDAVLAVLAGTLPMNFTFDAYPGHHRNGVFPMDLWVNGVVRYRFGKLTNVMVASTLNVRCSLELKLTVPSGWVDCGTWS
jgi:hypothetical protein